VGKEATRFGYRACQIETVVTAAVVMAAPAQLVQVV